MSAPASREAAGAAASQLDPLVTWRRQPTAGSWISDLAFVDADHGWVSDFDARHWPAIRRTEDGGQTWERQTLKSLGLAKGRRATAWGIAFSDPNHGWAVGDIGLGRGQLVGGYAPR